MSKVLADPPSDGWTHVSRRLTTAELITHVVTAVVLLAITALPLILRGTGVWPGFPGWLAWAIPAVVLAWAVVEAVVIPFRVRSRRYALRPDDIAVARGVIYHRTEVIPYGRIQYVDVKAGPLLRGLGLCTLQVHTASPDAHPTIMGLRTEDGAALREELSRRGEQRLAGL